MAVQQADRIGLEAGHDIQFDLRPAAAEHVHRRHQPVEAGVAFDRDAQLAGFALHHARQIAFGFRHLRQHRVGQFQQALAGRGEAHRHRLALEQRDRVIVFQMLELVRQRRLGQIEQRAGAQQAAGLAQRVQGFQMA